MLLVSITAAPLTEEIAFRGYAMGLLRRHFGPISALVITAWLAGAVACRHASPIPRSDSQPSSANTARRPAVRPCST